MAAKRSEAKSKGRPSGRARWQGSLGFGLVSFPVRLYPAVKEHNLHFHLRHAPDNGPIGYEKVCKLEGHEVPDEEIVRAFEIEKGQWVQMDEEDFAAAQAETFHEMEVQEFVDQGAVDPAYFRDSFYLDVEETAAKPYKILTRALEESELVAVVKFVMREREHLGVVRPRAGLLVLERLFFADELRPLDQAEAPSARVKEEEVELAKQLIATMRADFDPRRYKDTYHDALCQVIRAKQAGQVIEAPEEAAEAPQPIDLMEALRQSIAAAKSRQPRRPQRQSGRSGRPPRRRQPAGARG